MDARARRVVENESRFRLANERIRDHVERESGSAELFTVLCECADNDCTAPVDVEVAAYEWVRGDPVRFIVLRGHEAPRYERVIRDDGSYLVVAKRADTRPAATELDPRSS